MVKPNIYKDVKTAALQQIADEVENELWRRRDPEPFQGLDGFERDMSKLKFELVTWWPTMKPHFIRYLKRPFPHECTNVFVEACRASAYFFGHVLSIVWHLVIAGLVALAITSIARADQVILDDGTTYDVPEGYYVAILPDYVTHCVAKVDPVPLVPEPEPEPPTCQDAAKYCGPERCQVWPDDPKCATQQDLFNMPGYKWGSR